MARKWWYLIGTIWLNLLTVGIGWAFSLSWQTDFSGSSGHNPDLPDWSEFYVGACGTEHRLEGGLLRMQGGGVR